MTNKVINISILGSTGSIGTQTLEIVRAFPERFRVIGLACSQNIELFKQQVDEFKPGYVHCREKPDFSSAAQNCSLEDMASLHEIDVAIVATTGRAGLRPAIAAIRSGKKIALANKEILAMAGQIISELAVEYNAQILPIDSEHSAVWQCLRGESSPVRKLILTASGGPFIDKPHGELAAITPEDALNHPTWKMGRKVTIDSATLFNKGLEVMEARWLFDIPFENIEIVIHRQSIIHSMVEFADGSVKAQLGMPDMRLPIQYALFYPDRIENANLSRLLFDSARELTFEPLVLSRFPCLQLALEAGKMGGTAPAVLCAADEIAVELFLQSDLKFTDIEKIIEATLNKHTCIENPSLDDIFAADEWARVTALELARKENTCH